MPAVRGRASGQRNPFDGSEIHRPIVWVTLNVPGFRPRSLPALVDSGANATTVPRASLEAIGVDVDQLPPLVSAQGLGGKFDQRRCDGEISWRSLPFCQAFAVVDFLPGVVLGRADFFATFAVSFSRWNERRPIVTIDPYSALAG